MRRLNSEREESTTVQELCKEYIAHNQITREEYENNRVKRFVTAIDAGRPVNPTNMEGQVEGGVTMALGFALMEKFEVEEGKVVSRYRTLGLPRADEVPELEVRMINRGAEGPAHGAKGCGEISTIPVAPALQLAYYNRTGVFQTSLPLDTPYWKHHEKQGQ